MNFGLVKQRAKVHGYKVEREPTLKNRFILWKPVPRKPNTFQSYRYYTAEMQYYVSVGTNMTLSEIMDIFNKELFGL